MTLQEATAALDRANAEHRKAETELACARRAETNARNKLNQAQKDFDECVKTIKADAPYGSDWFEAAQSRVAARNEVPRSDRDGET